MNKKLARNTNFEILRIIAMVMIVAHHFAVHSGLDISQMSYTNNLWISFLRNGGKIGVNLFVLISGYFLVNKSSYKSASILKLYIKALIYGLALFFIGRFCLGIQGPIYLVISPFSNSTWWFLTFYFVLFLTYPFINKLICSLDKKSYRLLIIITGALLIVPSFVFGANPIYNNVFWFFFLYIVAGYIKIFGNNIKVKPYILLLIYFAFYVALTVSNNALMLTQSRNFFLEFLYNITNIGITNNIFNILLSICFFLAFKQMKEKTNKFINILAGSTLGVYLIHDSIFISGWLWNTLCQNSIFQGGAYLILHSLYVIPIVYISCTLIDLLYTYTLELAVNKLLGLLNKKCLYRLDNKFNKVLEPQTKCNDEDASLDAPKDNCKVQNVNTIGNQLDDNQTNENSGKTTQTLNKQPKNQETDNG